MVATQIEVHAKYGGVVPELASRKHDEAIVSVVRSALGRAGVEAGELDGVAVTRGPGLVGGLLVGLQAAKGLSYGLGIPFVGVNHVEGHLLSIFLEKEPGFPFVGLVVSGGHTTLVYVRAPGDYRLLGSTRDDAAGEAFDKVAKLLGLSYPGGISIEKAAREGDEQAVDFPRAFVKSGPLDFSFSGLKTSVRNHVSRLVGEERLAEAPDLLAKNQVADISASFQYAVVRALVLKSFRALVDRRCETLVVTGGVAANERLRRETEDIGGKKGVCVLFPSKRYCTDNAAMIAALGHRRLAAGESDPYGIGARSRWPVGDPG